MIKGNSHLIAFRNHDLLINMKNIRMSVTPRKIVRIDRPELHRDRKCERLKKLLTNKIFQQCLEPGKMTRLFFEIIGYLMAPSEILSHRFIFFGDKKSGKHELFEIIKPIIHKSSHSKIIMQNYRPDNTSTDEKANYDIVIPFHGIFDKENSFNAYEFDIIKKESPGIVTHAIWGLRRLITSGNFHLPADCITAHRDYYRKHDILESFFDEHCIIDEHVSVQLKYIHDRYIRHNTQIDTSLSKVAFKKEMISRGFGYSANGRKFIGISLKE